MTRTFANPEELMIALLQGEKWSINNSGTDYLFYSYQEMTKDYFKMYEYGDTYTEIKEYFDFCDGKTLWHKVEDKPKKKTVTIIKFYSSKGKILEVDKSRLSDIPKNIIDEYEIEVYDD